MTANICFKIGKYLIDPRYKDAIVNIMEAIDEIETVNVTIQFTSNYGLKKDGMTVGEATEYIGSVCEKTDAMDDDAKNFVRENYLEEHPEDRELPRE